MAIDINGLPYSQTQNAADSKAVNVGRGEPKKTQEETGRPSTADTVSLTDTANSLRTLENTLANLPVSDSQRVEAFREAILNGSYKVDAERVAEKLLQFDEQLG